MKPLFSCNDAFGCDKNGENVMNLAIIGCGKMGEAMLRGILSAKIIDPENVIIADIFEAQLQKLAQELKVQVTTENELAVKHADVVILAVKPIHIKSVLENITKSLKPNVVLISIAAGVSFSQLNDYTGENDFQIVRAMPNTPALVSSGATGVCFSHNCTEQTKNIVSQIFTSIGLYSEFTEAQLAAVTGVSGSGPAFVAIFIEAMADAGVLMGMTRKDAIAFALQTVEGTAKLIKEGNISANEVKEAVSSPGGTTIAGIEALEANGFRHAVISAVKAAANKAKS